MARPAVRRRSASARPVRRHRRPVLHQRHHRPAQGRRTHQRQLRLDVSPVDQDLAAGAGCAQPRLPADVPHRRRGVGHCRPVRRRHQSCRARIHPGGDSADHRARTAAGDAAGPRHDPVPGAGAADPRNRLSSLRLIVYGAAPIPAELLKQAMGIFPCGFQQVYGLTETTGAITLLPPDDHDPNDARKLLSCGYAQTGVELRIVGDDGEDLPAGTVGEIAVRSPQIMHGYWRLPDASRRAIQGDWFLIGDAGYLDDKGYLYIYDRVKDMIVSGGEDIYPAEVESALFGHPAVADVAVIGVPDERWGEAVKALVVKKADAEVTSSELITWARERIAGYKLPKSVDFIETLPRNPTGKILKRELRKSYWGDKQRQVN